MTRTETEGTTIVSAQVDVNTRQELERLARQADRTLSAEIRRALMRHLAGHDNQAGETQA